MYWTIKNYSKFLLYQNISYGSVFFLNELNVYQKLQLVILPMILHLKSNQYKVYFFQNKYFSYRRMSLFFKKTVLVKCI